MTWKEAEQIVKTQPLEPNAKVVASVVRKVDIWEAGEKFWEWECSVALQNGQKFKVVFVDSPMEPTMDHLQKTFLVHPQAFHPL